jgi:dephospho-CoA kinase
MSDLIVGLTGGVASGKSEVARRFAALGIAVADADLAARAAVEAGSMGLAEVVEAFGTEVLLPDGSLDRAAMRRLVFADDLARRRLESIIHPRVRALLRAECEAATSPYAIAAIPLLAEAGSGSGAARRESVAQAYPWLDRILVVDVPEAVQAARVMARDGVDVELARRMIAAQAGREERLAIADDVIANDGPREALDAQVVALHDRYLGMALAGS